MRHRYDRHSSSHGWGGFAPYVPVAQRRANAEKQRAKLAIKGEKLHPVTLAGFAIASKWWGKTWCKNLEHYADYANRIGRGRSYVRSGMVLDLRIAPGTVTALVQGSQSKPYKISVQVALLSAAARSQVETACLGQLGSLTDLLAGQFPKGLESLFTAEGIGLFPSPREITFACSCPDSAHMCKHVAAVLYGIGARFDDDPGLFFALRGLDPQKLIGGVVRQHTDDLLAKAKRGSKKILVETDLGAVFGLEMATPDTAPAPAPATVMHPDTTRPKTTKTAAARPTKPIKAAARPKKMKPTTPAAAKKRRVAPR
jgi:uncharacterized Zn finger protein